MSKFSHFDESGASRMVDVGEKAVTRRTARASGRVVMQPATLQLIREGKAAKGDVLEVARLAGIMAAKRTSELIPLCHPLALEAVAIEFTFPDQDGRAMLPAGQDGRAILGIEATVQVEAKTGVEMEALMAVSMAALTVYDMCKSVDRGMVIGPIRLEEKSGGKSGDWRRS
jgi:cyclic pyranopterin phosphate synthase